MGALAGCFSFLPVCILAAALFMVLGKGGHPLFVREINSRRLDREVGKQAYGCEAKWDSEADTDSVDEREEMPAKKVFRRKGPLATVRRGRLRGGQVDSAALSEFQRMTSVAGKVRATLCWKTGGRRKSIGAGAETTDERNSRVVPLCLVHRMFDINKAINKLLLLF